jgi:hypothetical protein
MADHRFQFGFHCPGDVRPVEPEAKPHSTFVQPDVVLCDLFNGEESDHRNAACMRQSQQIDAFVDRQFVLVLSQDELTALPLQDGHTPF